MKTDRDRTASQSEPRFLVQFPASERGVIGNFFHGAVRDGATDPEMVLRCVRQAAHERLRSPHLTPEQKSRMTRLNVALSTDREGASEYAGYCLQWRDTTPAERDRLRKERALVGQREWMRNQPPTGPQLEFLRALGHHGTPDNRLAASMLIDKLRRGGTR